MATEIVLNHWNGKTAFYKNIRDYSVQEGILHFVDEKGYNHTTDSNFHVISEPTC